MRTLRKLLLPASGFPEKINAIESVRIPPTAISKQDFVETAILQAINTYNPKLNLQEVEYSNINNQFSNLPVRGGKLFGAIIEDEVINASSEDYYRNKGYYIWINNGDTVARRIVTYVFILDLEMDGRNIVAQSIFPELIELMDMTIGGPCYKVANHPVYILNMLGSRITQSSIYYPITGMIAADMEYIEVFANTPELVRVPSDIRDFIRKYEPSYRGASVYSTPEFEIDFRNKSLKIKDDKLVVGDYLKHDRRTGLYEFNGSSEKFYWAKILPYILLAHKNGYTIDYAELENFYNTYTPLFSRRGTKLPRFLTLLRFIEKLN